MCLHSPVSLEGVETKDLAGKKLDREKSCLLFKTNKSIFQWNYQKEKSPICKLAFWGIVFTICMGHMATFPSVFKVLVMFLFLSLASIHNLPCLRVSDPRKGVPVDWFKSRKKLSCIFSSVSGKVISMKNDLWRLLLLLVSLNR